MADQRPAFRFRLPWLLPSAPAPAPAPAQAPAPAARPTGDIQIPAQPTTTTPVVRPPFRPTGVAPPPPPQVQEPPRTESQPSSPSRVGAPTRVSSQPSSPARAAAQARAASQPPPPPTPQVQEPRRTESQPSSPSRAGAQTRVPSQPASPARAAAQGRAASQPQSPARVVPPPRATSQPSSPARPTPRAASQAASPSHGAPQPRAGSQPSSPSHTTPQPQPPSQLPPSPSRLGTQPRTEPVARPLSPPKTVQTTTQESSQPPPISAKPPPPPPISEKEPSKPIVSQPQVPEARPSIKHLKESDEEPEETKDEKEVEKTSVEPKKKTVIELLTEASSRLKAKTKEQPTVEVQENQLENQENLETKEKVPTSIFSEKQTKPAISRPKDRSPVIESRQKPAVSSGQRVPLQKEIREDISKFVNKMAIGHTKHNMDEKPVSVITIAGENRGAMMNLGSTESLSKREGPVHIHRAYKLNPDESTEATTDGEGISKDQRKHKEKEDEAKKSYINSNTQGINNSIVFNTSITERNPGVHLVLSHNLKEPVKSNDRTESLSRAEINITPSQKLTYEPTIRRRCLRGLFMEHSDSDTDNPDKPRRHGCLYVCGEKSTKDNNIDVL